MTLVACGPSLPTPAEHAEVLSYEAAQIEAQRKCVREGTSRPEVDACRARARADVDRAYGRTP
jgi:hypothetical protein